jgi:hypothetical protein
VSDEGAMYSTVWSVVGEEERGLQCGVLVNIDLPSIRGPAPDSLDEIQWHPSHRQIRHATRAERVTANAMVREMVVQA